jgi:hypothetical protein
VYLQSAPRTVDWLTAKRWSSRRKTVTQKTVHPIYIFHLTKGSVCKTVHPIYIFHITAGFVCKTGHPIYIFHLTAGFVCLYQLLLQAVYWRTETWLGNSVKIVKRFKNRIRQDSVNHPVGLLCREELGRGDVNWRVIALRRERMQSQVRSISPGSSRCHTIHTILFVLWFRQIID